MFRFGSSDMRRPPEAETDETFDEEKNRSGTPLEPQMQRRMERAFGRSFGGVRVLTGADGDAMTSPHGASAAAIGETIAFAPGEYHPGRLGTEALLAHELAHVAQQARGGSGASDQAIERDADRTAARAIAGLPATPAFGTPLGLRLSWCKKGKDVKDAAEEDAAAPESDAAVADPHAWAKGKFEIDTAGEFTIGTSGTKKTPIRATVFEGQTEQRALIIGGVHGSELAGIEVAEQLVASLKTAATKPHFTTVIVPVVFPESRAEAEDALRTRVAGKSTVKSADVQDDKNIGRHPTVDVTLPGKTKTEKLTYEPNRNFPLPGTSLDKAAKHESTTEPLDARGRPILAENQRLMELISIFKPARIVTLHSKRWSPPADEGGAKEKLKPGIFADPRKTATGTTDTAATESDNALAIAMATAADAKGARVPGNELAAAKGPPQPLYGGEVGTDNTADLRAAERKLAKLKAADPKDDAAIKKAEAGVVAARRDAGISFGMWAPQEIAEGGAADRPGATTITVEVAEYYPSTILTDETDKKARAKELEAHRDAILQLFLANPDDAGVKAQLEAAMTSLKKKK